MSEISVPRFRITAMAESSVSELTRQRLLHAAFDVFAVKGFDSGTVREITDRASANLAAVSYHFRGKEELYVAVIREAVQRLLAPLSRDIPRAHTSEQRLVICTDVLRGALFESHGASPAVQLIARELVAGGRTLRHVLRMALLDDETLLLTLSPWRRSDDLTTIVDVVSVLGALAAAASVAMPMGESLQGEMIAAGERDRAGITARLAGSIVSGMMLPVTSSPVS